MVEKKKTKKNLESIHHPVLNFLLPPERKESPPPSGLEWKEPVNWITVDGLKGRQQYITWRIDVTVNYIYPLRMDISKRHTSSISAHELPNFWKRKNKKYGLMQFNSLPLWVGQWVAGSAPSTEWWWTTFVSLPFWRCSVAPQGPVSNRQRRSAIQTLWIRIHLRHCPLYAAKCAFLAPKSETIGNKRNENVSFYFIF